MRLRGRMALAVLLWLCAHTLTAQSSIGGIINIYTPVLGIRTEGCAALLDVEDTTGFRVGDRVMLLQTMGCTNATGYVTDAVGLFEFASIENVRPNKVLELKRTLINKYDRCNFTQLIRVPSYTGTTIVTSLLQGRRWDGRSGGVIALEVKGTLILRNDIDASGIGFQGGGVWNGSGQCSTVVANTTVNNPDAAMKGGTFVIPRATEVAGMADLFSGGGGGVGHNSGGGGGGNGGIGGSGGSQWEGCGAPFDNGGRGGARYPIFANAVPYLRFGGGGGAGQMNNSSGTTGASGGGIVVIAADTITGNQHLIMSGGASAQNAGNDGAGGGGAGGCVLVQCPVVYGPLNISVNGGNGGNITNSGLHGPGGGGGGGGVLYSGTALPTGVTFTAAGGTGGRVLPITDAVRSTHLTKPGEAGSIAFRAFIPENNTPKPVLGVQILSDTTVCPSQPLDLTLRTLGAISKITWYDSAGKVLSTQSVLSLKPTKSARYVVTVEDPTGCSVSDTATVSVLNGWMASALALDLGTVYCDKVIDTSIVVVNSGASPGLISKVTFSQPGVTLIDTLPVRLPAKDTVHLRIHVATGNTYGPNNAVITCTLSPCDTVVTAMVTWNRQNRLNTIRPRTVTMSDLYSCTGAYRDTVVNCTIAGSTGIVTSIVSDGAVASLTPTPLVVTDGTSIPVILRWTPTIGKTAGRVGVVLSFEGCIDTLWIDVNGKVHMPRMQAPDTVFINDVVLCRNQPEFADVVLTSIDSTTWFIDSVNAPPEISADIASGDTLFGSHTVRVSVQPTAVGPFAFRIGIRMMPCDTTIWCVIAGIARDVDVTWTKTLTFSEPVIGRKARQTISYVNTGSTPIDVELASVPQAPFQFISSSPALPCTLKVSDTLRCVVELTQMYGKHTDSLVIRSMMPCPATFATLLTAEAYATTRLYMPDITSAIGAHELIPIILEGRPQIDSSLLDSFALEIAVRSEDVQVSGSSNGWSKWSVLLPDTISTISIVGAWRGGDTLALIPSQTLLSSATVTPLMFDTIPGFRWIGQQCDVVYRNGSITIGDICSGRRTRLVSLTSGKPITVAPNPAHDVVFIGLPSNEERLVYTVDLVDALGRVTRSALSTHSVALDVSDHASGVYHIVVRSAAGAYTTALSIR